MQISLLVHALVIVAMLTNPLIDEPKVKPSIRTVLILGNSIVRHGPAPAIGWNNDWGMAASSADSDFVHRLTYAIHQTKPSVQVRYLNIAGWERAYTQYNLARLDSLRNPDLLIMRVSENVNDAQSVDSNFVAAYDRLINYIAPGNKTVKVITDGFWAKKHVNQAIQTYAKQHNLPFVSLTDLSSDPTNMALTEYKDPGVGQHPSDKGMRLIASRIWQAIKKYFS